MITPPLGDSNNHPLKKPLESIMNAIKPATFPLEKTRVLVVDSSKWEKISFLCSEPTANPRFSLIFTSERADNCILIS